MKRCPNCREKMDKCKCPPLYSSPFIAQIEAGREQIRRMNEEKLWTKDSKGRKRIR